jgi:hypothetical protein
MELVIGTRDKANKGAFLHFTHPVTGKKLYDVVDGKPDKTKPVGLVLRGRDSDVFAQIHHQMLNDRLNRKDDDEAPTAESIEKIKHETLSALATGWKNVTVDGVAKFSNAALITLFQKEPWTVEQVDAFVGDRANFS